jgi:hypothetical protein
MIALFTEGLLVHLTHLAFYPDGATFSMYTPARQVLKRARLQLLWGSLYEEPPKGRPQPQPTLAL